MRIKYSLLDKLKNLKSTEMNFLLYIATKQDMRGFVAGVHNQDVCRHTGMCKQSFYNSMRSLEKKKIITVYRNSDIDYDILINDNDFSYQDSFREGYIDLQRSIFHKKQFKQLKAGEKWLLMYFLHITHENSGSYRIGTRTFYNKFMALLGVTGRVIRAYLHSLRRFFSIGIVKKNYYITYRHSVFNQKEAVGADRACHEHFVRAQARRNKIRPGREEVQETAKLITQYRETAAGVGYDMFQVLADAIKGSIHKKERPKERRLQYKYIHKLIRQTLALY